MSLLKKVTAIFIIPIFLAVLTPIPAYSNPGKVKLSVGNPVILKLTEEVSSATKNMNDMINLEVARDVIVDGKIVIKGGTPAIGTVTMVEGKGVVGKPGKIQFSVDSTKSVDDQNVLLRSTVTQTGKDSSTSSIAVGAICCIFGLFMKGGEASFPVGSEVKAFTLQDLSVEVAE